MTTLRSTTLPLSILSLALGLGACVDENADSGLIILHAAAPETGCSFANGATGGVLPSGIIQANASDGYVIAPVSRNDLTLADGEAASPKTILITGARVEILFPDPSPFTDAEEAAMAAEGLTRFEAPFAGSVEPNGGLAVLPFEAVPLPLLVRIGNALPAPTEANPSPRILLDVRIREIGTRRGSAVESNLFRFPVEVCDGCLVDDRGACVDLSASEPIRTGGLCQRHQDGVIDCCHGIDPDNVEVQDSCSDDTEECMRCPSPLPNPANPECKDGIDEPAPFVCPAARPQL